MNTDVMAQRPTPAAVSSYTMKHGDVICSNPNCGYVGKPVKEGRGSRLAALILFCLLIVPGIIYWVVMSGYVYKCPRCSARVGNPN